MSTVSSAPLPTRQPPTNTAHPDLQLMASVASVDIERNTPPKPAPKQSTQPTITQHLVKSLPPPITLSQDHRINQALAWHLTFNHAPLESFRQIAKSGTIPGLTMNCLQSVSSLTCSACRHAAQRAMPHTRTVHDTVRPGHSISSDTIGSISPKFSSKHRHVLTFLDMRTRNLFEIPIKSRFSIIQIVQKTVQMIAKNHLQHPRQFVSDNAREYLVRRIQTYLDHNGCRHHTTVPYHPEMNSLAEQTNSTLFTAAPSALTNDHIPLS